MSYVLRVEQDLLGKTLAIIKKPKVGKLMVGKGGQLHPKHMNLRRNLGINPTGLFTKAQTHKVFRNR
jgi:hypothetical protein